MMTTKPILLVDDEPVVLAALKETILREFHKVEVLATHSPLKAMKLLREHDFSCIIADQRMPEMLGLDFLVEAKKLQPSASRILITAVLSLPTIVDAVNKGEIFRFIAKPWLREELIVTVRNALARYTLIIENEKSHLELNKEVTKLRETNQQVLTAGADFGMSQNADNAVEQFTDVLRIFLHDLTNEFAAIGAGLRMLSLAPITKETVTDKTNIILRSMQYCQMQLSTLRALTRARDLPLTTVPIVEIINRATLIYKGLLPTRVKLITSAQQRSETVVTNLDVASFVIIELLRNAAKAMGDAGGEINLEIVSKDTNASAFAIRISDSGPGLPAEKVSAPFRPPPNGTPKGWGMYLCYRCALAIRAHLNVIESSVNGTVFEMALPTEQSLNLK